MSIVVKTLGEYLEHVFAGALREDIGKYRSPYAFRGIARADYRLETTLARLGGRYAQNEQRILRSFVKYGNLDIGTPYLAWKNLVLAQHYGVPTRLLDWTHSPFVALHFCTVDLAHFDVDGAVWCVDFEKAQESLPAPVRGAFAEAGVSIATLDVLASANLDPLRLPVEDGKDYILFFEPPSFDPRVSQQAAHMSIMPRAEIVLEDWLKTHEQISAVKLVIPAEAKPRLRDMLDQLNITEKVLFPGFDGLARWIRRHYQDYSFAKHPEA